MKKAFSIIALCMAIILCIPAVPALASNGDFYVILKGTENLYTGTEYTVANQLYYNCTSPSNSDISQANYNALKSFFETNYSGQDYLFLGNSMLSQSQSDGYIVGLQGATNARIIVSGSMGAQYISGFFILSDTAFTYSLRYEVKGGTNINNGSSMFYSNKNCNTINFNGSTYYCIYSGSNDDVFWNNQSQSHNYTVTFGTNDTNIGGRGSIGLGGSAISSGWTSSTMPIYSMYENNLYAPTTKNLSFFFQYMNILEYDFEIPLNNPVNAYTDNGIENSFDNGIGIPDFSFSDTNYNGGIAFNYQQTHLYTQYNNAQGANETCVFKWALDERSRSITQTTSDWLMHYYVIVYWHWTQATDSSVYTPLLSGGSGGSMAFEFDAEPDFIMQGQTEISIWDLVQHVPTISSVSDEDIVSLAVAVSCLNGNIVNSVWRDIFGQSGQYVGDVASEIISGGKLEVQGVGEFGGSFINNLFNPAYYYALDDLRIKLVAHPWSGTKNIHGGNGDFDLNLRSNDSYGTTQGYVDDGGTPEDPSDDTQYPTNTVPQQNNVVVPVTYPTSGGNVTVYSVVQVPDSGGGGGNSINYSPTFSPSIVMDSGLDDLKETVDAYPQVPNQHFWDYFLVFKDNAFLDATSDFFGALPNELSSLLISSIGIIGVFAIYRFVRRR